MIPPSWESAATLPNWRAPRPAWFPEEFAWVVGCTYRGMPAVRAPVRNLLGGNASFRREAFEIAGGFQNGIGRSAGKRPLGCEETEFCIRVSQRSPEAVFLFDHRATIWHLVTAERCRFSYFRSRCYAEGLSKALVTASVGTADGLSTERRYTTRVLPSGVAHGVADALRGDLPGLGRAGAIVTGVGATAAGYAAGWMQRHARRQSGQGRGGHAPRGVQHDRGGQDDTGPAAARASPHVPRDCPGLGDRQPAGCHPGGLRRADRLPAQRRFRDGDGSPPGGDHGQPGRMAARRLPNRVVVLTFDDGFEDFHRRALPVLDEYGYTATVFVTSGWIQDAGPHAARHRPGRMLSWSQIAEIAQAGIEIGAHSWQHPQLDQLRGGALREELYASKAHLEDRLGGPVPGLAYPFGYSSARVRRVAREAGDGYACAVTNTMANGRADLLALPRLTVRRSTSLWTFQDVAHGRNVPAIFLKDRALTKGYAIARRARATVGGLSRDQ